MSFFVGAIFKSVNDVVDLDLDPWSSPMLLAEIMLSRSCVLGRAAAGSDEDLGTDRGFPEIIGAGFLTCTARVRLAMSLRG